MNRFAGIERLMGANSVQQLSKKHIMLIGIGGVGSWVAEALARSGVGKLTLVDMDEICVSNMNRQLHALEDTVGKSKIAIMAERIKKINPECTVNEIFDFFTINTAEKILGTSIDYVIDCIDSVRSKCDLIDQAKKRKIPLIVIGAAGGKFDPTQICISDLSQTKNDMLLTRIRKKLRQDYAYPRGNKKFKIPCVYSTELAAYQQSDGSVCQNKKTSENTKLDCQTGLGTASFITGTFAFFAVSHVLKDLIKHDTHVR
ncbi:MAG: tRNA threonylcarbamoyladenosine dehydratase [Bacteriovoracaceae bacterium]|nr:tRNA threonylcarbamoyladenosine dehydratase [Bacteriovoracaceae bacterium]